MKSKFTTKIIPVVLSALLSTTFSCTPKNEEPIEEVDSKPEKVVYEIVDHEITIVPNEEEIEIVIEENEEVEEQEEIIEETPLINKYVTATENATIYSDHNTSSDKMGMLIKGTSLLFISSVNDDWCAVKYDGKIGYIKNNQIEVIEDYEMPCDNDIPTINNDNILDYFDSTDVVIATAKVNVRDEATTASDKLDQLRVGDSLPLINVGDEWCEVDYYGRSAYVYKEYVKVSKGYYPKYEMADMVYMTSKTPLYDLETNEKILEIPIRETAEVYGKTDDFFIVNYGGNLGYVSREHSCSLGDDYFILDISSQHLKLYKDDKLLVETDVVTGNATKSPTYCGLFAVREKARNVHWKEFKVTVKYWMPFNRGEGFHDADWRKKFGGTIYKTDGSHGCVNIPPKVMPKFYDNAEVGTPVLVKK